MASFSVYLQYINKRLEPLVVKPPLVPHSAGLFPSLKKEGSLYQRIEFIDSKIKNCYIALSKTKYFIE